MTTVDKVLTRLASMTKEQEGQLACSALDDVINTFDVFTKAASSTDIKSGIKQLQDYLDDVGQKVQDVTNISTKLFEGTIPEYISGDEAEDEPKRKTRRPSRAAKVLLTAIAGTAEQVSDGIAEGKSNDELRQLIFPARGIIFKVVDADVDTQVRIRINKDGSSFRLQQRQPGGWSNVTGGQSVKNFNTAVRHAERLITDKADTGNQTRRSWLANHVIHEYSSFETPSALVEDSEDAKAAFIDSFINETFKRIENVGIDIQSLVSDDTLMKASNKKRSRIIVEAVTSPWNVPKILLNAIDEGIISTTGVLANVLGNIADKIYTIGAGKEVANKYKPGSGTWAAKAYANNGTTSWWGIIAHAISQGFKQGWQEGQEVGRRGTPASKYRHPNNAAYRENPRGYWKERGKLVTQLAQMEAKYEDAITKARTLPTVNLIDGQPEKRKYRDSKGNMQEAIINPRADALEQAIVNYSQAEDRIENLARPLDVSLEAVRAHFNEILSGNPDVMPPGEGFPTRFGGYIRRRALEKNVDKFVPQKAPERGRLREGLLGKDPKFEALHEEQQGDRRLAQVQGGGSAGGMGTVATTDREYLKPGQQAPEGVREHYAERRGKEGKQARYYSRKEAARVLDEQKNGLDKQDSLEKTEDSPTSLEEAPVQSNVPVQTGGGNPMEPVKPANPATPKQPEQSKDPEQDQFQMAIENEVAASKRVQQKSKARSAKAQARVAAAKADEAEVKARRAEEDRESHIAEILSKLDDNISSLVVKSDPGVADVFTQLEKTIDSLEKDVSIPNPFRRGRNDNVVYGPRPDPQVVDHPGMEPKPAREGIDFDRHVAPKERSKIGSRQSSASGFEIQQAGKDEMEGVDKQFDGGPSEINAPGILAENLSAAFRAAGKKGRKKKQAKKPVASTSTPDSPESTTSQPSSVSESLEEQLKDKSTTAKPTEVKGSAPSMAGPYGPTSGTQKPTGTPKPAVSKPAVGGGMHPGGGAYKPPSTPTTPTTPKPPKVAGGGMHPGGGAAPKPPSGGTSSTGSSTSSSSSGTSGAGGAGGAGGSKPFYYSDKNDLYRNKRRKK